MLEQVPQPSGKSTAAVVALACAERAAAKRASARRRIHARALHPIDVPHLVRDPLVRRRSSVASALAGLRWVFAGVALHLLATVMLITAGRLLPPRPAPQPTKALRVRIVETSVPVEPVEDVAPKPTPPEPQRPKLKAPKPTPKPKLKASKPTSKAKPKAPKPKTAQGAPPSDDKPNPAAQAAAGSATPLPLIGLSLESTVSGAGPAYVTGNSRMGRAPDKSHPSGVESKSPIPSGAGTARTGSTQRAASRIPTRDTVLTKPKRLSVRQPPYPATLRAQGIEGDVLVKVSLDARGLVKEASVIRSAGYPEFDSAALAAARAERFSPANRDGKAVPFTLSYSYRFRIED